MQPVATLVNGSSGITTSRFHCGFGVLAGTASGVVLLFDTRTSGGPVQQSCVSMSSHAHQVVSILPAETGMGFASVSSDGRVCEWDSLRLDRPVVS